MKKICVFMAALLVPALLQAGIMNIKYIEREKNVLSATDADTGVITIRNKNAEVRLLLNYPYIISGNSIIRIDSAPQSDGGEIFISKMAYEEIAAILSGGKKETPPVRTVVTQKQEEPEADAPYIREAPAKKDAAPAARTPESTPVPGQLRQARQPRQAEAQPQGDKVIILDPGHGGVDPGAIGPSGIYEKDVVLDIALKAERLIRQQPGVRVLLTRKDDTFVSLRDRAVFANNNKADLFISIHCNASPNRKARGTRTYIYSRVASSKEAAASAKFENRQAGMFEFLLNDLRKGLYELLSIEMAGNIQHSLVKKLKLKWEPTERAPFYVLANTNMPSVLVEVAFISNREEEKKLNDSAFRELVAQGINAGVKEYIQRTK